MRNKILPLFLLCSVSAFSQPRLIVADSYFGDYYIVNSGRMYHYEESTGIKEIINSFYLYIDPFGYQHIIINANDYLYIPDYPQHEIGFPISTDTILNNSYAELSLSRITASSYLIETLRGAVTEYRPDMLLKRFLSEAETGFIWNTNALPWVEGAYDAGIGESLTLTFDTRIDVISILNGFIDLDRKHLFYENNRVKKIRITSIEPGNYYYFDFLIEDGVKFSEISLPTQSSQIMLEILEVYPGTKWNDTCISAVIGFKRKDKPLIDVKNILNLF